MNYQLRLSGFVASDVNPNFEVAKHFETYRYNAHHNFVIMNNVCIVDDHLIEESYTKVYILYFYFMLLFYKEI